MRGFQVLGRQLSTVAKRGSLCYGVRVRVSLYCVVCGVSYSSHKGRRETEWFVPWHLGKMIFLRNNLYLFLTQTSGRGYPAKRSRRSHEERQMTVDWPARRLQPWLCALVDWGMDRYNWIWCEVDKCNYQAVFLCQTSTTWTVDCTRCLAVQIWLFLWLFGNLTIWWFYYFSADFCWIQWMHAIQVQDILLKEQTG